MHLRRARAACGAFVICVAATAAGAQTTAAAAPPAGRLLASNCFQCHGTNGAGPGFERLNGESANEIYKEMLEMRAGKEGQGLMTKHAMGYTDAQLRALSQYLASLPTTKR